MRYHDKKGKPVNPVERLATMLKASGIRQSDAGRAAATPSASTRVKGSAARRANRSGATTRAFPRDAGAGSAPSFRYLAVAVIVALALLGTGASSASAAEPPTVTLEPTIAITAAGAELTGTVDAHGQPASVYAEYATSPDGPFTFLLVQEIAEGTTGVTPITAVINGLKRGTTYYFRLDAETTAYGEIYSPEPYPSSVFTPVAEPLIEHTFASPITDTGATLNAVVDPEGATTTIRFQYLSEARFQADGESFGEGTQETPESAPIQSELYSGHKVSAAVDGLQPGTAYAFRVLATNERSPSGGNQGSTALLTTESNAIPAPETCPNEALRTGPSAALPDCRAYEQVTPVEKSGQDGVFLAANAETPTFSSSQVAADGDQAAYFSFGAFSGSPAANPFYLATRGSADWSSQSTIPSQSTLSSSLGGCAPQYAAYSPDLSRGVLEDGYQSAGRCGADDPPLVAGEPRGVQNLFLRDNTTGSYQLIDVTPTGVTPADATFQGASQDLRHVIFNEPAPLTPDAGAGEMLYEWSGGSVTLVGLIPTTPATACSGSACTPAAGATLGAHAIANVGLVDHAVSDDGSRVFFTADGNLYLREGDTTTQIDVSHGPGSSGGGEFTTASNEGGSVLFTDPNQLTGDASPSRDDLYRYEVGSGQLTDLTPDIIDSGGAAVQGVVGASDDTSYIYFVADGVLTTGANSQGDTASPGDCIGSDFSESVHCNLYLRHDDRTVFIARLSGVDPAVWNGESTGRVTPDGTELAFGSVESLTGYDNDDQKSGRPDSEVYLYDATADELACASCNPSGARPIGPSRISEVKARLRQAEPGESLGEAPFANNLLLPRNLSEDGSRLFFESDDALVPADTNARQDVYEYEGGEARLISSGRGDYDSYFYDASTDGNDVFIVTREQLVGQDTDDLQDLYDARVDGGFASQSPSPSPAPCLGEVCRGPEAAKGSEAAPGSLTFSGQGNLTPPPAAKVTVKTLTGAQKLAAALKTCRKEKRKQKRAGCEKAAQKKYGAKTKSKSKQAKKASNDRRATR